MDALAAVNRLDRYQALAVVLGLASDMWGTRRSRADKRILPDWVPVFSASHLSGNSTLSGPALAQTQTTSTLASVLTPSATVEAAFSPPTAYVHRLAVPMSPGLATWTTPPMVLGFLGLLVLLMVAPTLAVCARRALQSARALGRTSLPLLRRAPVTVMVSMQHTVSLVVSALGVLCTVVSLVANACASFAAAAVAAGSLVQFYVWSILHRLIWIVRNGYRIALATRRFARVFARLHTVSARFVMRIARTVVNAALACVKGVLVVVIPVVCTVVRIVLAVVNFIPTCVWNRVIPNKVRACARWIAAAVDTTRRRILYVISVYQSLACRVKKAATVVQTVTNATIFAVSRYSGSCVYIVRSVFVILKGLVDILCAVHSAWQRLHIMDPSAVYSPAC